MHELSITQNILEITLRHAEQSDAKRVKDIYLVIGQLSSVVDDSVQFYWDLISTDTLAEGAQLHFRRIQTELVCQDCRENYHPGPNDLACPKCGGTNVQVVKGKEFFLEAINIEADSKPP